MRTANAESESSRENRKVQIRVSARRRETQDRGIRAKTRSAKAAESRCRADGDKEQDAGDAAGRPRGGDLSDHPLARSASIKREQEAGADHSCTRGPQTLRKAATTRSKLDGKTWLPSNSNSPGGPATKQPRQSQRPGGPAPPALPAAAAALDAQAVLAVSAVPKTRRNNPGGRIRQGLRTQRETGGARQSHLSRQLGSSRPCRSSPNTGLRAKNAAD